MRFDTVQWKEHNEVIDVNYFFKCLEKLRDAQDSQQEKEIKYFIIHHFYITGLLSGGEILSEEVKVIRFKDEMSRKEYTVGISSEKAYINEQGEIVADFYFGIEYKFVDKNNLVLSKIN